jgi:EAL domain-containing protein (putative c-di-GMP-specific phosphodiesterase class I)
MTMDNRLNSLFAHLFADDAAEQQELPLAGLLTKAVMRNELRVHFQPQFEADGGRGCGVEALARWTLTGGEEVPPAVFIPIAERIAMMGPLGEWILQRACETVVAWEKVNGCATTLSVNVSTHQINREFCAALERILKATGFPGERLELEITESSLIANADFAIECFESWRDLGVHIAVDDFGTGFSSLNYLSRLPLDCLKIDKSFVHRMPFEPRTLAVVRSVLALGADMGMMVLAEGIETEEEFSMLRDLNCRQVQGFLFAKPVPAAEARALLTIPWGARLLPNYHSGHVISRGLHAA